MNSVPPHVRTQSRPTVPVPPVPQGPACKVPGYALSARGFVLEVGALVREGRLGEALTMLDDARHVGQIGALSEVFRRSL